MFYRGKSRSLSLLGPKGLVRQARPVVLGLGHTVPVGDALGPLLARVGSSLGVPSSEVLEDSGLLDVGLVSSLLLGGFSGPELVVLGSGQASRNVRRTGLDLTDLELHYKKRIQDLNMLDY